MCYGQLVFVLMEGCLNIALVGAKNGDLGLYFVVVKRRVAELFDMSKACLFAMGGWSLS